MNLAARESAAAWDLRGAWASRAVVVLALDAAAEMRRLAGWVEYVSPTAAVAELETLEGERISVPCAVVLSVRRPHYHEPADAPALAASSRAPRETVLDRYPDQLSFDEVMFP